MADDTRVVQMQFDNKDFEKNIKTSQSSLERFKSALNFDSVSKGLEKFAGSVKDLTFTSVANNIQKLTDKFTGLGTASEYVLSRIRNKLESLAGKAMSFVDSMTTVQMSAGFAKYESLNKAVQVLKSATGKEEKEVYDVLERLNKYTDETSYDFAEGVTSISKLVSSGAADMATAEKVVEGFFNLAAKAGADTQQASHALQYSINQAMGTGYMGLNDWKTLENLNIATIDFKEQLLEAAVAVGTVTKEGNKYYTVANKTTGAKKKEVNATNLFRESLNSQWITTKVLNQALTKYGDTTTEFGAEAYAAAQRCTTFTDALNAWKDMLSTGWMTTYRLVFGDLTDAMNLFSGVCNKVSAALQGLVDTRNKILNAWKEIGGRDNLFGALFGEIETPDGETLFAGAYGILDAIEEIGDTISEAFWGTFMNLIPKSEQDKILSFVNSNLQALGLEKPFESFKELYDSDFFKETGGREGLFGGALQEITQDFQNAIGSIHDWFSEVDENGVSRMQKIQNVLTAVGRTIAFVVEGIGGLIHFFEVLGDDNHLGPSLEAIGNLLSALGLNLIDAENSTSESGGIIAFFDSLAEVLKPACDMINQIVGAITGLISSIVKGEQETGQIGSVFQKIGGVLKSVFSFLMTAAKPVVDFVTEVIDVLGMLFENGFDEDSMAEARDRIAKAFTTMWEGLKAAFAPVIEKIKGFFKLVWETVSSKVTEYFNDPNSLGHKILEPLKAILEPVINFFKDIFAKLTGTVEEGEGEVKRMTVFEVLGDILAGAFNALSKVNLWKLASAIMGGVAVWKIIRTIKDTKTITGGITELVEGLKHPIKWLAGDIFGTDEESFSDGFLKVAKGIALMTGAIIVLGNMDLKKALVGIGLIAGMMLLFVGIKKLMDVAEVEDTHIKSFIGFAISLSILFMSLQEFKDMDWTQFGKMMAGLAGVMAQLIGVMLIMSYTPIGTAQLGSFIGFATSIGILILSLQLMKNMDWTQFGKMMAGLGGVLLQLIAFMLITTYAPIGTAQLGSFIGFAISLGILFLAIQSFKNMDWTQFGKMMAGLGGVLSELLIFMGIMSAAPIGTAQLGGFITFAISMWILVETIRPFGEINWEQYGKVMAGLGGVLAELLIFMGIMSAAPIGTAQLGGFITFAISLWILAETIKPFAEMNWDQYGRAMAGLGGLLAELLVFMGIMAAATLSVNVQLGGFIAFAASLWILAETIKPFAEMSWGQYGKTMAGFGSILAGLLGFMAIVSVIPVNPAAIGAAVALAAGIAVMALAMGVALAQVRNVKWETITAFTGGMAVAIIAMAGAIAILSAVPMTAGLKGIVLLGAGIAAILGIVALVGPAVIRSIGDSFADLSGKLELVSGLITGFSNKMGQVDEGNIDKAGTIFDKLKTIMGKLSGWGKFTKNTDNFTYSMFALGTAMEIFNLHAGNAMGEADTNANAALKFIQDLSGCAGDLTTIEKMNMDTLTAKISGLGGAMYLFGKGAKEVDGIEAGETPDVTGAMAILQSLSTALNENGGFTIPENMPDADAMSLFGASIAALAAGLVLFEEAGAGLGAGTAQALTCLDFFQQLKQKLVDTEFSKNLKASVGIFDESEVDKNDLTEFGANIEQLGLALKAFHESVTILDAATGERTPIDFSNAVGTLDSLVALQGKLGWDFGPVIQFFAGRTRDFTDLGANIEALGTAMSDFIDKLGGVDEQTGQPKMDTALFDSALEAADKVASYLNQLREKMGKVGGLWNILGSVWGGRDYNFTDLKEQMTALATGIGSLGQLKVDDKLITVDDTTGIFKAVDSIITYLTSLQEKMGSVGGIMNAVDTMWNGRDYNFTDLKQQLIDLGAGLNGLSVFDVEDLPTKEEMEASFPTIDALLDYMKTLKTKVVDGNGSVGGLVNILNSALNGRDYNFTDLEKQLTAIGTGLNSIANVTVDANGDNIFNAEGRGAAIDTMDALIEYMQTLTGKLGRIGGIAKFFSDLWNGKEADFEYLGGQLGYLGEGLGKFQAGITKSGAFDAEKVSSALGALDHLVSMMQTFSVLSKSMDAISQSYGLSSYTTQNLIQNMVNALFQMTDVYELEDHAGRGSVVGQLANFVKEFDYQLSELGGLDNANAIDILQGVATAISQLVTAAKDMQDDQGDLAVDFSVIGTQICAGVVSGIEAGQSGVITAAVNMAVAAYEAAKGALDINSPSRVFAGLGLNIGEGFVNGMNDSEVGVASAADALAGSAVDSATSAMATFASLMSQDIDANPTIAPVLDLSNVRAGSALIDGMLSGERDLSLAGAGSSYSSASIPRTNSTTKEYTGQDLSGVYTAIANLGSRIDAMGSNISKMQVVMNTGALVGEVTDGINRNLGQKTIYRRRRN